MDHYGVLHGLRVSMVSVVRDRVRKRTLSVRFASVRPSLTLPSALPVAIVGAGPAGLTLSTLLSQFGVPSVLVEKEPLLPAHPQAHFINLRTMEIMRHALGGLDRAVLDRCPPREEWRDFVVCSSVLGRHLARVNNFPGSVEGEFQRRALSPTSVAHFSQSALLPLLLEDATSSAERFCPSSKILFSTEARGLSKGKDRGEAVHSGANTSAKIDLTVQGAVAKVGSNPKYTSIQSHTITCDYVVAADGAGSKIRSMVGLGLSGRQGIAHLVNVHFRCKPLARLLRVGGPRPPGMLYFVYNEEVICVLVAHNIGKGEWTCQIPFLPPYETSEDFTPERSLALVRHALGPRAASLEIEICSIRPWTMSALVADCYDTLTRSRQSRGGREGGREPVSPAGGFETGGVFLLGDAAHQFPPAGGFGLNTGVQDAHNLAWKLAAVYHGAAPKDLLVTYDEERRPLAMRNAALSVRNFRRSLRMLEALGVHPELETSSALIGQLVRWPLTLGIEGGVSSVMSSLFHTKERAQKALRLGRSQLKSLRHPGHPYGDARVRLLHRLLDEGGGLPLLFPQHDVGFSYDQAVPHGGSASSPVNILPHGKAGKGRAQEGAADFTFPRLRIGARMPHFLLRPRKEYRRDLCGVNDDKLQPMSVSTVDLPDQIRRAFLSVSGCGTGRDTGRGGGGINVPSSSVSHAKATEPDLASLMCVLLVAAGKCARGSRSGGSRSRSPSGGGTGDDPERADVPEGAASRWRTVATQVRQHLKKESRSRREMLDSPLLLLPPLVVLEVSPCSLDPTPSKSTPQGRVGLAEKATPGLTRRRPEEISHAAEVVQDGNDLTMGLVMRKWVESDVPPTYTFDDPCGNLCETFDTEEVEAVLLRPDGHIAWAASCGISWRMGWDGSSDYKYDAQLVSALKDVYAWAT